jgi:hypothetical protein
MERDQSLPPAAAQEQQEHSIVLLSQSARVDSLRERERDVGTGS